jgi:hypothetical protein
MRFQEFKKIIKSGLDSRCLDSKPMPSSLLKIGNLRKLETSLSNGISQSHKDKYYMFSIICGSQGETKQSKKKNQVHESKRGILRL